MFEFYITPEEYERAAKYGVRPALLEVRIRSLAWKKEKAITTPPQKKKRIAKEWVELAEKNGICYSTLKYRINVLGWEPERAATQPLQDRKKQAKIACEKSRKYPKEIIELAKKNGIPYDTFRNRVRAGWSLIDAATRPVMTRREIGLMTKEKRCFRLRKSQ
jgi:hypothetical protein